MKKKKIFWIFGIVLFVVLAVGIAGLGMKAQKASETAAYVELGNHYLTELDYEQAIVSYKQALELTANNYDASMGLAEAYDSNQMYAYAEAVYQSMLEEDETQTEVYKKLAELYIRQDKKNEAEKLLLSAAEKTDDKSIRQLLEETHPKAPVMNYDSGTYSERIKIELSASEEKHIIYYTLDGSDPSEESAVYTGAVILPNGITTVKAVAFNALGFQSDITENEYNIAIADRIVEVSEPVIDMIIRSKMNIPYDQPIYNDDIERMTELYIIGRELTEGDNTHTVFMEETSYIIDGYEYGSGNSKIINSLQDLRNMPFLENVVIAFQPGLDITGIESLSEIKRLSLVGDDLTNEDVAVISNINGLETLNLGWNSISDITALGKLNELTSLGIWGNKIRSIEAVRTLEKLEYLDFSDNLVEDITPVRNLTELEQLWMYHNQISDISSLVELDKLSVLMLYDNPIHNPEAVKSIYPHLRRLDVDLLKLEDKEA